MSLFDTLFGFLKKEPTIPTVDPANAKGANARYNELLVRYHACQNSKEKAALWKQMTRQLHSMVFLAAFCYADDNPRKSINDRELHMTSSAKMLYSARSAVNVGNPGYVLATRDTKKEIHLRTFISKKTNEVWVPLYTDFERYTAAFGETSRVTLISFAEARKIAQPYNGLIINPGEQAIGLSFNGKQSKR